MVHVLPDSVIVEYRLEVDPWTVVFQDLPAVSEQAELRKLSQPREFYATFTRCYAPVLADGLDARMDGRPLLFTCSRHQHQVLDHLRCDFEFQAPWQPAGGEHQFSLRKGNYEDETALLRLSLTNTPATVFLRKDEPEEALKTRLITELKPGDEERLRVVSASIRQIVW